MPGELPQDPWLLGACAPLFAVRPAEFIGAYAIAAGSASIRLLGPRPHLMPGVNRHGVGLAMVRASRPGRVFLPTAGHLRRHLAPSLHSWIDQWETMLATCGLAWTANGSARISVATGEGRLPVAVAADAFTRLAAQLQSS